MLMKDSLPNAKRTTKCEKNFFYEKFYGCKDDEKHKEEHPPGYA